MNRITRLSPALAKRSKSVTPCIGEGMIAFHVILPAREVVLFKGILEACDGLASVFAEYGGDLWVAAPADRGAELDAVLGVLCAELGALRLAEERAP